MCYFPPGSNGFLPPKDWVADKQAAAYSAILHARVAWQMKCARFRV